MLGQTTDLSQLVDDRIVTLTKPLSFEADQFRRLRLRVEQLASSRGFRVIAVTSAAAHDGKTLTAVNLAAALAAGSGARVLLIDADFRRPSVAKTLRMDVAERGVLAAIEKAGTNLADFVCPVDGSKLHVLPCESSRADTYELLSSPAFAALLAEARRTYDFVIVDTPPVVPVPDTALLQRVVDGYLIVVSANVTPRRLVAEALNLIEPTAVIGLVLNRDDKPLFGHYGAYREYFKAYARSAR